MFWHRFSLLYFVSVAVMISSLKGDVYNELKQEYAKVLMDCVDNFPVTPDELNQLRTKVMPDSESAKCLFACAYKQTGMMDEKGKLSFEGVYNASEKIYGDQPDRMKIVVDFLEACEYVNEMEVTDGERGCDRAALIFKCSAEKAPEFSL